MDGFTRIWAFGQWALVAALMASPLWAGAAGLAQPFAAVTGNATAMRAFAGDAELKAFLAKRAKRVESESGTVKYEMVAGADAAAATDSAAEGADAAAPAALEVAEAAPADGITNVQTAGVDEGGIVKKQGGLLIVLRRGRLFTIDTSGGGMRRVAAVDVFPGQNEPDSTWYDEMLVNEHTVVVLGYSYARSGTEVNRFALSADGKLTWRDTHYLRSGDYYSSRNYASRLIGNKLIFYAPLYLKADPGDSMPALAAWEKDGRVGRFKPFATPRQIYMPDPAWRDDALAGDILHSVMICDLGGEDMACKANNVLGGESRSFYVSRGAVYVWTGLGPQWGEGADDNRAMLYRIPLDGAAPQAIEVAGAPLDQFSFREEADGTLHVLTMAEGGGDAMWQAEANDKGDMALLRLSASRFGNGGAKVKPGDYRVLPGVEGWERQNRFVGDWLLYAGGAVRRDLRKGDGDKVALYAVPVQGGAVVPLDPAHGVGRIDVMGRDAIIVGSGKDGALVFTTVALDGAPRLASRYAFPAAGEGENRSHAFFYRPDPGGNGDDGLLGLPVMRSGGDGTKFLGSAASILYLRRAARDLSLAGTLDARPGQRDDHCLASCVDWYGNARPVFFGGRIFALMGYELVEGRWLDGAVREKGRIDFTPDRQRGR